MKKIFTLAVGTLLATGTVFGQADADTSYWSRDAKVNLSITNTGLVRWAGGGLNSLAIGSLVNANANYLKGKHSWDNSLDLAYGLINQYEGQLDADDFFKNDDRIEFNSKYGFKPKEDNKWYYAALGQFRSQFAPGYSGPGVRGRISDFFAPAYAVLSLGIDWKPSEKLSIFIGPISSKFTFVSNQQLADQGAFGVQAAVLSDSGTVISQGENFRAEMGGIVKIAYKTTLAEDLEFETKADFFSNYLDGTPLNIDVNWSTITTAKVLKIKNSEGKEVKSVNVSFSTQLIYDHDIDIQWVENRSDGPDILHNGPTTQFKHVLGVGLGLAYKF